MKTRHTCLFKVKFVTSRGTEQHEYQCALLLFVAKILRKKNLILLVVKKFSFLMMNFLVQLEFSSSNET